MILDIENCLHSQESTRRKKKKKKSTRKNTIKTLLEQINLFRKIVGYKINILKATVFL